MSGAALPVHQHVSNFSGKLGASVQHFTLQQIRRIGIRSGLMDGAFATRLRDLSDEQLLDKIEKDKDAAKNMREFVYISYSIGEKIVEAGEMIDTKIDLINKVINDIQQTDKNDEAVEALKDYRDDLKGYKDDLAAADKERTQATDETDLKSVKAKVLNIIKEVGEASILTVAAGAKVFLDKFKRKKKDDHDRPNAEAP